ncbi:MAG: PASTA domain-containing protein [Deltaproteobacteria bacterium]
MHGSSVILLSLFTSVLTATGATYVLQRYQMFPGELTSHPALAPMLVGLSEADARANTVALQLALLVEGREPSAGVSAGTVLRQSIAPGQPVPEGGGIAVVFAATLPAVPKVTELSLGEATEKLTRGGYKALPGEAVPHPRLPTGSVVSQFPEADAELAAGSPVTLHLSSGPAELAAPKLLGMPLPEAKEKLAALGLGLKVRWISRAETVENRVLSQKPSAGQKLAPKSVIEVVANR